MNLILILIPKNLRHGCMYTCVGALKVTANLNTVYL
jgi:hypothetical protein